MAAKTEGRILKAIIEELKEEYTIIIKTKTFIHSTKMVPIKWDTTFQTYDIDNKSLLEALKKLAANNTLKHNGPETNYSRRLLQYNPNLKGRFNPDVKQETSKQQTKGDKTIAKEIAEVFSAVTGQEISEEEVSLIQGIQLSEDEVVDQTKDMEASEEEAMTA